MSDIDIEVEHLGKRPFDWAQGRPAVLSGPAVSGSA